MLVGGGGAYLAASSGAGGRTDGSGAAGGSGSTPPPLALDAGEPAPYGATYVAHGDLPGGPGSAPVYAPKGGVGKDAVTRLARALGVDGTPVAEGGLWRVGGKDGTGPSLQVNRDAPGIWTFSRYAPGTDNCKKGALCTHDPMGPTGTPVSVSRATGAAAPVLKAAGLDDAKIDASQVMGVQRVVNAEPVVGGLPTYGWATGLTVDARGEVVGGHGLLGSPVKGDTYPVLSAARTLKLMNAAPKSDHRMGIGGCTSPVPAKNRLEQLCGAPVSVPRAAADTGSGTDTVTVGKAVFGLAAHSVAGRQTLVPSWLFEVRGDAAGGAYTVTYPAVDPAYLGSAAAPSAGPTSAPKPHSVKVNGYTADGRELTVSFFGGVCADYSASAKENGDRVTVTVTERPWPDKVCVLIAKEYVKTVRLAAPLDGRAVVGADGSRIPQAKPGALRPDATARTR
ncbi:membrane protein [Streptomyces sp. MMG1121]|nr:membrane protein [Streptomyces sp. MMG1121]